jgi:hypothetical protein
MRWLSIRILVGAFVLAIAADAPAQSGPSSCTTTGQNLYARDVMSDLYFWYREIRAVDPTTFDSPEAYLDAIRYLPLDRTFSYITSRAAADAFFSESQSIESPSPLLFLPCHAAFTGISRRARGMSLDRCCPRHLP